MTVHNLILAAVFCFIATITPGPNNILLSFAGSRYGFRKNLPYILGIRLGIMGLFIILGFGIGLVALASTNLYLGLKFIGGAYLVYLALKIGLTKPDNNGNNTATLIGFNKGTLLQFINPKAMTTVLSGISTFTISGKFYIWSLTEVCLIFSIVGFISNSCWTLFGVYINRLLATPKSQRWFNWTLALLLLITVAMIFFNI